MFIDGDIKFETTEKRSRVKGIMKLVYRRYIVDLKWNLERITGCLGCGYRISMLGWTKEAGTVMPGRPDQI